ncbi:MAG: aspartate:alanine exchanger family transporter [Corynebacterium sp.]|nr:aspartate:alanine exchanger family transporter [Corynebacterium sp.]
MAFLDFLAQQPLIALVFILAVGLALGKVKIAGISFGAAMVLFVALGLSTLHADITIPPLLYQLGLAMFVYVIGLSAGAEYFANFKTRGWKISLYVLLLLFLLVGLAYLLINAFGLVETVGSGMFAGAVSSTPGMASQVELLENLLPEQVQNPVVGYSLAYPGAVLGSFLVASVGAKLLKVKHVEDAMDEGLITEPLQYRSIRITKDIEGTLGELSTIVGRQLVATRLIFDEAHHEIAQRDMPLNRGMIILVNGTASAIDEAVAALGEEVYADIKHSDLAYRRFIVSSKQVAGRTIAELNSAENGFVVARVRRGDSEFVPRPDEVLQYSDRVRVVAPAEEMESIKRYLGDSERALADADLLPFSLGLLMGLLIGAIPIPLPGGSILTLGFGGGPIIAGLILGAVNRTGPIQWQLPYHANRTINTLGLSLFLAGVGTSAGASFRSALTDPASLSVVAGGLIITVSSAVITAIVGMKVLRLKWDEAMGVAAGVTTNPAVISFINGQTRTELPNRGYATAYPTAMIMKIIAAQLLLLLFV